MSSIRKYEGTLKDLEKQGGKFTDAKFPPQIQSYDDPDIDDEGYGDIEWYRATKMS